MRPASQHTSECAGAGGKTSAEPFRRAVLERWSRIRSVWPDGLILCAFVLLSYWVLFAILHASHELHLVWTGTDSPDTNDQMQYLAWIRDASSHLLASNLFVSQPTPHDYLEPLVVVGAALVALGASPPAALLIIQPFAVVLLFLAVRTYAREVLGTGWRYRAAVTVALFYGLPWHVVNDLWIPFLTWGYMPAVLAIAALTAAVVYYERAGRGACSVWIPALLGLVTAWLHPWEGEEFVLIVILTEVARKIWTIDAGQIAAPLRNSAPERRRLVLPAAAVIATALPLLYVSLLGHYDPSWHAAQAAGLAWRSPGLLLRAFAPLLLVSAFAWFRRPTSVLAASTRAWVLAASAVCGLCYAGIGNNPGHALSSLTIPLALLSVEAASRVLVATPKVRAAIGAVLVLAVTVPMTVHMMVWVVRGHSDYTHALIRRPEARAMKYLARQPKSGSVLTPRRYGAIVPAETGHATYVGNWAWSNPRFAARTQRAIAFFYRPLSRTRAKRFVRATGVRYVLSPCQTRRANVTYALKPLVTTARHFGCATVYTLRAPGDDQVAAGS